MPLAFVDTNCLLLLIAGSVERNAITQVKRVEHRTAKDYRLLLDFIEQRHIAITPHVVVETSNLIRQTKKQPLRSRLIDGLAILCRNAVECELASADAVSLDGYPTLGVTDAVLLHLSDGHRLITADRDLWSAAHARNIDAVNIDHYV